MRILVVEDEFLIAMEVEDTVRALGHEVLGPAGSRADAKALGAAAEIALVDIRLLDGATGLLLAEDLRRDHGVTVIFTTGNPESVMSSKAAIGVVQKPYRENEIASAIEYAISRRLGRHAPLPPGLMPLPA